MTTTADETRPCECGKAMVLCRTGVALACHPPVYRRQWRCYGCGARCLGPDERPSGVDADRLRWEAANPEPRQGVTPCPT